jgi:hypothetical protein
MAEPLSMDLRTRFACGGGRWSIGTKTSQKPLDSFWVVVMIL